MYILIAVAVGVGILEIKPLVCQSHSHGRSNPFTDAYIEQRFGPVKEITVSYGLSEESSNTPFNGNIPVAFPSVVSIDIFQINGVYWSYVVVIVTITHHAVIWAGGDTSKQASGRKR